MKIWGGQDDSAIRAFAEHACGSKSASWTLRWKESPDFIELFSDLQKHPLTCVHIHTVHVHKYTHKNNNFKKNWKFSNKVPKAMVITKI